MADEEEIGPICIITSNGIICMESEPVRLRRNARAVQLGNHRPDRKTRTSLVGKVAKALPTNLANAAQRRHIGCLAVYLAEAAQLLKKQGKPFSFEESWTIVKRPKPIKRR